MSVQILLIDDHALFRSGLRLIIESKFESVQVMEAGSLEQALEQPLMAPDVILLDVRLPGLNGLESIGLLRRRWTQVPIIMLSSDASVGTMRQAHERGASAFVSKADKPETIAEALRTCLSIAPSGPAAASTATSPLLAELTPRQLEVLTFLSQGLPNKSIAKKLDISENTVRGHVQSLLGIFQASSRSEAVYIARRQGLLD